MEMVVEVVSPKKRRLCSVEHFAMFPIACVRLRTGYNEAGVIVLHKTEVAIALWRISPVAAAHRGFLMRKAHGKYAENHNSLRDKQERLH